MPRVSLTVTNTPAKTQLLAQISGITFVTAAAASATDGNQCNSTGRELVYARNTATASRNVTITSAADHLGRTKDIVQAVAAGAEAIFGPFPTDGWRQSDGKLYLEASGTEVLLGVAVLP